MLYPHFLLWLSPEVGRSGFDRHSQSNFAEQWPVSPMIVLQLKGKMWVRAVVPKPLIPFLLGYAKTSKKGNNVACGVSHSHACMHTWGPCF